MKRKRISPIIWLWTILSLFIVQSCDRRPLEEETSGRVTIPIKVYWDRAEIAPKNVTAMFYAADGTLYKEWRSSSFPTYAQGEVELEPGHYTVVVFNELRDQIDFVRMRGWQRLETFEAYSIENPNPAFRFTTPTANEAPQVYQPGILAACLATIHVTPEMQASSPAAATKADLYALTNLHPDRKTAQAQMIVHVNRLSSARMPAIAQLRNMASSYFFATDRNSLSPVTAQFTMNNRRYDPGSNTNGTISAAISTFGVLGEWHHTADTPDAKFYLDIAFMLADATQTIIETTTDITDVIEILVDEKIAVTIKIEIDAPPLPVIKPVGGDSGFSTDLVDWNKVIIPLKY